VIAVTWFRGRREAQPVDQELESERRQQREEHADADRRMVDVDRRVKEILQQANQVSDNGLYRIESGRTKKPKDATRRALAKALGVAQSKLF
jgi:transcriptional regulator with XRE-family HTH domain